MGSYKVEVQAFGTWLPATHKYFKKEKAARSFEERFVKFHLNGQKGITRVKAVGRRDRGEEFIIGFNMNLFMFFLVVFICLI
jgi:hypothetical protein